MSITPSTADDTNDDDTFDDLSSELETSFGCGDDSILDILDGNDSGGCDAFTDVRDALEVADYDETDALETLLHDLLDCDGDKYGICECEDYVPETIIYADDYDEVEGDNEGFDVYEISDIDALFDTMYELTYYIYFIETGEYDQYGCTLQEVYIKVKIESTYFAFSDGTEEVATGVIRSDPACVETAVSDVNEIIQLYSEIADDEVEEEVSSFNSTYLLYGLGGILGFGMIGVCCLALSASKVDAVNKSKSTKKKKKKSKSKRELREKEESRKRRRDKKKRCVPESIV